MTRTQEGHAFNFSCSFLTKEVFIVKCFPYHYELLFLLNYVINIVYDYEIKKTSYFYCYNTTQIFSFIRWKIKFKINNYYYHMVEITNKKGWLVMSLMTNFAFDSQ